MLIGTGRGRKASPSIYTNIRRLYVVHAAILYIEIASKKRARRSLFWATLLVPALPLKGAQSGGVSKKVWGGNCRWGWVPVTLAIVVVVACALKIKWKKHCDIFWLREARFSYTYFPHSSTPCVASQLKTQNAQSFGEDCVGRSEEGAVCGDSISGASRGKCKIMRKGFVCIN